MLINPYDYKWCGYARFARTDKDKRIVVAMKDDMGNIYSVQKFDHCILTYVELAPKAKLVVVPGFVDDYYDCTFL